MRTQHIVIATVIFAVALVGGLAMLVSSSDSTGSKKSPQKGSDVSTTSEIWKVGDSWTVNVRQDAGAITPDGKSSIATVPFRFQVAAAPKQGNDFWVVRVKQDGAEGPFAKGWRLEYRSAGDTMKLARVAVGSEPPLEAELAGIVLGSQFPYELTYSAPPRNLTLNAAKLEKRATLPPQSAPGTPTGGVGTPPAAAPALPPPASPSTAPAASRG